MIGDVIWQVKLPIIYQQTWAMDPTLNISTVCDAGPTLKQRTVFDGYCVNPLWRNSAAVTKNRLNYHDYDCELWLQN